AGGARQAAIRGRSRASRQGRGGPRPGSSPRSLRARGRLGRRTAGLVGGRDGRKLNTRPRRQPGIPVICLSWPREGAMTPATLGFAGFRPAAFAFLNDLRDNNDPVWFKPRKALYEAEVLGPFRDLIVAV